MFAISFHCDRKWTYRSSTWLYYSGWRWV